VETAPCIIVCPHVYNILRDQSGHPGAAGRMFACSAARSLAGAAPRTRSSFAPAVPAMAEAGQGTQMRGRMPARRIREAEWPPGEAQDAPRGPIVPASADGPPTAKVPEENEADWPRRPRGWPRRMRGGLHPSFAVGPACSDCPNSANSACLGKRPLRLLAMGTLTWPLMFWRALLCRRLAAQTATFYKMSG